MYNFYMVEAPMQLLSAIENKKDDTENILIVNCGSKERISNFQQLNSLILKSTWSEIIYLKHYNNYITRAIYFLIKYVYFRVRFYKSRVKNAIFLGEFRSFYFCLMARIISVNRITLLDDGLATISLQKRFFSKGIGVKEYHKGGKERFFYKLVSFGFNIKINKNEIPNVLSNFNLDNYKYKDQVIQQSTIIKSSQKAIDVFYFFGSKYSEIGILKLEDEVKLLGIIFEENRFHESIYYIPHRDEGIKKLKLIESIGYKIKTLDKPAEIYFIDQFVPKNIAGFYSAVLLTLPKRYLIENILCYDLRDYIRNSIYVNSIDSTYEEFKNIGLQVTNI